MHSSLTRKLNAYGVQAREVKSRAGVARIPAFATTAGAALAMTTSAEAGIIYSGVQDVSVMVGLHSTGSKGIDIKNPGGAASTFKLVNQLQGTTGGGGGFQGRIELLAPGAKPIASFPYSTPRLLNFASGHNIAGERAGSGMIYQKTFHGGPRGHFVQSVTGFVGFYLPGDGYGWIRLEWSRPTADTVKVTAIDWAYNDTPGGGIVAGQMTSVPEPSTLTLAVLAAGSAGVMALRKRRQPAGLVALGRSPRQAS